MKIKMRRDDQGYSQIWDGERWLGLPMPNADGMEFESTPDGWKRVEPPTEKDWLAEAAVEFRAYAGRHESDSAYSRRFAALATAIEKAIKERDSGAAKWEADHQQRILQQHGLADEFPWGCDAIDAVAESLVSVRLQRDKLQAELAEARGKLAACQNQLILNRECFDARDEKENSLRAELAEARESSKRRLGQWNLLGAEFAEYQKQVAQAESVSAPPRPDGLLPCPQCAGQRKIVEYQPKTDDLIYDGDDGTLWKWTCSCGLTQLGFASRKLAIAAANRRTPLER